VVTSNSPPHSIPCIFARYGHHQANEPDENGKELQMMIETVFIFAFVGVAMVVIAVAGRIPRDLDSLDNLD